MDNKLKEQIMIARPSLHVVAPLTFSICWGYVIVNFILGFGMFFLYKATIPLSVADIFSYQIWGLLFLFVGIISMYGLLRNYWVLTRSMLMCGLVLKCIWAIALIIRCMIAPQTIVLTAVWLFFAYIQAMTYIYFLPKNPNQTESIQ